MASVAQGDKGDVARAVAAAEKAARLLARMSAFERARLCHRVADLLTERREQIATSIALEQGKPYLLEALPEVDTAAEMFRDAAEGIKRLGSTVFESSDPRKRVFTVRQPRGVYGIVTPWNFPLAIPSEYLSAGLASGNAMVLKPSEWTPVSAWHLGERVSGCRRSRRDAQPRLRVARRRRWRARITPQNHRDRANRQ